ncbi:MAG: D-glycerate dehydrogenase [Gammaproteobacteria bacterium]
MSKAKLRVFLTRRWPESVERVMSESFDLRINQSNRGMTESELGEALAWADVLCPTVTDAITAQLLSAEHLKTRLLANFGVGFNHIDMAAAGHAGIAVTNTPGVLTDATAEIALTLLLSTARRAGEGERLVRSGEWTGWHPTHMLSTQVTGKTLGIIGLGRIGLAFARQAHFGLGMQILYSGRSSRSAGELNGLPARYCDLEELLRQSDFVSLHCPATPQTRHLINSETLALMKPEAHLINTARGDIVHESDLVQALRHGVIAGAGLDVYEAEPQLATGLTQLANVVLLPHMGSGTTQTRVAMGQCALANIRAFAAGEPLPNQVG